jgi:hypothetical protein
VRLDELLAAPVALVVADEGLGKSTLIRDYLDLRDIAHLRFSAAAKHAAPSELLRGIAATFGAGSPAAAGDAAAWARENLANMSATIVLDELHHIAAEPRCIDLLRALIEATQPRIRWILAMREAASLPVPRWLASGICRLPIESDELRVQPEEIQAAFARAGVAIGAQQTADLYERSAGWALGLRVALRTGRLELAASRERVYDELVDAALRTLSADQHDRIFESAAIGWFDEALSGALECGQLLNSLLSGSELVHPLAAGTYAFYEPCSSRLAQRLDALEPERRMAILDRAAAALDHVGRWHEALALRVRAGDAERVAAALDRGGFPALDRGDVSAVAKALAALDEPTLMRHPVSLALKAALASLDESLDVSEAWFRMAIETARDHERRDLVIRYGMDLVRRGRDDVIALLEAEAARAGTRADADADAALWALLGTAYVQAHRRPEAREAARKALVLLPGVGHDALRARVLHQASYVALSEGEYDTAKQLAQRALARADAASQYDLAARALSVLFNVAMLHDEDVPVARESLLRLEEAGRRAGNDGLRLYAFLNAYALEVDAGDVAALDRLNRQLGEMQVLLTPMVSEALLPAQALRAAWSGRFDHAYDLLAPGAENLFDDDRIAYRWAEVAVYASAAAKPAAARVAIASSRSRLTRLSADEPLTVRSIAYIALAESLLEDDAAAAVSLAEARAAAAKTHGRIRTLVETIAAFRRCRKAGTRGVLALAGMLDELERHELGGVARFIERLPIAAIEARPRYEAAG